MNMKNIIIIFVKIVWLIKKLYWSDGFYYIKFGILYMVVWRKKGKGIFSLVLYVR